MLGLGTLFILSGWRTRAVSSLHDVKHARGAARAPVVALLSEETLPSEDLSPAATPSVTPAPPGASTPEATPSETGSPPPSATPNPEETGAAMLPGETPPEETPADIAPPLDMSNVPSAAPVSDTSLEPLIDKTADPALATSLRTTEEARRLIAARHPDEAIRELGRAVSIDASNPYAYFYLGRAWLMKGDYKQALTFLIRAEMGLGSNPQWLGETLGFEGACQEELGRYREAATAYRRALEAAPGNLMARAGYGRLTADLPPPSPSPEATPGQIGPPPPPPGVPLETAPEMHEPPPPPPG